MIKKIFELEDRTRKWIETHRIKWCFFLTSLGFLLGLSGIYFIGMSFRNAFISGISYASFLLFAELAGGGKGIE